MVTFLLTQVPSDYVPSTSFETYDAAYTACVDGKWPEGGLYKDDSSTDCTTNNKCWTCYLPRYVVDYRFWFSVFSFFWLHAFYTAVGQCTIAGAVGVWFFSQENRSLVQSKLSVFTATRNCWRYHLGS